MQREQKGFTLIELLMVVAILAIIASIVLASLNSARVGARNADRNEMVRQYIIALGLYHNTYGVFPTGGCSVAGNCTPVTHVCLGNSYPGDTCYVLGEHLENSTTNSQISEFIPGLPSLITPAINGSTTFTGLAYGCTNNETCTNYRLSWVLEGGADDVDCYGGAVKTDVGPVTICTFRTD